MCDWHQVKHSESEVEREKKREKGVGGSMSSDLSFTIHRGWNEVAMLMMMTMTMRPGYDDDYNTHFTQISDDEKIASWSHWLWMRVLLMVIGGALML